MKDLYTEIYIYIYMVGDFENLNSVSLNVSRDQHLKIHLRERTQEIAVTASTWQQSSSRTLWRGAA